MKRPKKSLRQFGLRGDVGERAYRTLREGIRDGSIAPGQRLVELALCDWLKVSRTPVRDALRRLQASGLVELAPGGGLQVATYDLNALNELYLVREVLEGTATGEAARHATQAELSALQESIRLQRDLANDIPAFAIENQAFHGHLYQAAHNRFLVRTLHALHDSVALLGPTAINTKEWVQRAIAQHIEIVDAISRRDPVRATELMRMHIRSGFERRVIAFKRASTPPRDARPVKRAAR